MPQSQRSANKKHLTLNALGIFLVPGLLSPKPFRPGTPRPRRFGPFFNPGLLGPLKWDRSAHFIYLFIFAIYCFILLMCIKTKFSKFKKLCFTHGNRGIIRPYRQRKSTFDFIRGCMALPSLPHEDMRTTSEFLMCIFIMLFYASSIPC